MGKIWVIQARGSSFTPRNKQSYHVGLNLESFLSEFGRLGPYLISEQRFGIARIKPSTLLNAPALNTLFSFLIDLDSAASEEEHANINDGMLPN